MSFEAYGVRIVAGVRIALLAGFYAWVVLRNRREGAPGHLVTRSRLTCPKCHQTFDYDYLPGASVTAIRLGSRRYMRCPLCHPWSTFDLSERRSPPGSQGPGTP
jgi:hypothetical protein